MDASYKLGFALGFGGLAHLSVIQALKVNGVIPEPAPDFECRGDAGAFIAAGKEPKEVLGTLKEKDLFGYSKF